MDHAQCTGRRARKGARGYLGSYFGAGRAARRGRCREGRSLDDSLTVTEEFDHTPEKGHHSRGHRATSRILVRLSDPEIIGQLIAKAAENVAARIDGPQWLISLDNPARLEAARRAAADASRKAQAYAEGVGARLGSLVRLSEPGVHHEMPMRQVRAALTGGGMHVEQGEHEVAASIDATFELEAG